MTRSLTVAGIAIALALAGCSTGTESPNTTTSSSGSAAPTSTSAQAQTTTSATTSIPPPPEVRTLPAADVGVAGATGEVEATIYSDAANAPGAKAAPDVPNSDTAKNVAGIVGQFGGIRSDDAVAAGMKFVTVFSADGKRSMDVPADWSFSSFDGAFGARQPTTTPDERGQSVLSGVSKELLGQSRQSLLGTQCRETPGLGVGSGNFAAVIVYACSGFAAVHLIGSTAADADTDGDLFAVVKDATGMAALMRAVSSFTVTN